MQLRSHQQDMLDIVRQIQAGSPVRDIYAAVTPGAGKSWLPVIAAKHLIPTFADKICWVVPRTNLAKQAEDVFGRNKALRELIPHTHLIRASKNEPDPSRGLSGYVTTYQAIGMDVTGEHQREFRRHRYILVLDEPHHIADEAQWPESLAPLVQNAVLRIFMSGTFERHDRRKIAFLPYRQGPTGDVPDIDDPSSQTAASITYTRQRAIEEGSIANLIFRRHDADGIAWESAEGEQKTYASFDDIEGRDAKAALWTALSRQYAYDLLNRGIESWQAFKQNHPWAKLLIVAHNQARAQELDEYLTELGVNSAVAISNDTPAATKAIDRFKGLRRPKIDALVTVQMAYEGLDVPEISHVVCLTGIRSKPWLEQCFARAARIHKGKSHGYIWVPNDPMFRWVYEQIVDEQEKAARPDPSEDMLLRPFGTPQGSGKQTDQLALGITPLGASVGAETNSDLRGMTLTSEETEMFASYAEEEGVAGLAPIEVKQLISDGQLPYLSGVSAEQVARMRKLHAKRQKAMAPPPALLRPSDHERQFRDKISGWVRKHAYKRWPGDTPYVRTRRATYIKQVNAELARAFGPRDRLHMDQLVKQWEHVQRYYPA